MSSVAVIGAGLVGSSWALVFARAGMDVVVYDPDPAASARVREFAQSAAGTDRDTALAHLRTASTLEEALAGADYVQESSPERLEIKKELYRRLDAIATPDTILASSTSGLPASAFTEGLANNRRCLVVHPINPPHLVPLVEIVPAPWTAPEIVTRASDLMERVGQSPIRLRREVNGFVVNRLQSALLGEAFRLVEDGICDAGEVDLAISDGLGLRWFFMGPFQTIDLNAPSGVAEYCRNLGPMYYDLAKEQADPRPWGPELVDKIERQLRQEVGADQLAERKTWRDEYLAELRELKARKKS